MVEIVPAKHDRLAKLESFFGQHWQKQDRKDELYQYGRYIKVKGTSCGFFALVPFGEKEGQLRTLYLTEAFNPGLIMVMIDWIKEDAQKNGYSRLWVESKDQNRETLFKTWGFEKQANPQDQQKKWWTLKLELSTTVDKSC
ncbi:hypothetical protein [Salirhabdus salicampi]|uniref:hypothetical protein n=1 Tax=Salirhabdus salicampi TaxID=476102 RepID=UPI0020C41A02|nr:hypothetical protein [Salirhabdus salicampi]MCP8617422.1 hypothetical protein [Salirhabdus salicampi]